MTSNIIGDYTGATSVYNAGDEFPIAVNIGDVYVYGDYEYRLGCICVTGTWVYLGDDSASWGVRVIDATKNNYGEILDNINSLPVNLMYTFYGCSNLVESPIIPSTVESLYRTYQGCTSLLYAPNIPNNVKFLEDTFVDCTSLTLKDGFTIPEGVEEMEHVFKGCTSITTLPDSFEIPSTVWNMQGAFYGCNKLSSIPDGFMIPDSVEWFTGTFNGCSSLTTAPIIGTGVNSINRAFENCVSLTGIVTINGNPTVYEDCFLGVDMSKITLAGSSNIKQELANTGTNGDKVTITD